MHQKFTRTERKERYEAYDKLLSGAEELVHGKKYHGNAKEVFHLIKVDVLNYMRENNILLRRQFKWNCLWYMSTHPDCVKSWEEFVAELS
jgi:hypothetical protein